MKAYAHNGYFKSLKGIVHLYNIRDVFPTCPDPFTTEADAMMMNRGDRKSRRRQHQGAG